MSYFDLHTHTVFSDGKNTPEEMVEAAIARGMGKIGFSDHSYTSFDRRYCMKRESIPLYRETILALKEKYRGRIEVLLGIEQDYYAEEATDGYDYVIGSVHYLQVDKVYIPVDEGAGILREAAVRHFGGDILSVVERYFETVSHIAEKQHPTMIGHFDLIRKYNQDNVLYDENHPRVVAAARRALEALLPCRIPFEINTGGIYRGCRQDAYPAPPYIDYIRAHGGRFILSSDSHETAALCYQFPQYEKYFLSPGAQTD